MSPAIHRDELFVRAVEQHYPALIRRLTAVLRDHEAARDIAQEAYLRAYLAWDRFDGTDVRAWLYTIGLRLAFNERERRRRWHRLLGDRRSRFELEVASEDLGLHSSLGSLRREHRAALLLNVVDGYTHAEIAAMLGVSSGTVASWVYRAKEAMREALRDG